MGCFVTSFLMKIQCGYDNGVATDLQTLLLFRSRVSGHCHLGKQTNQLDVFDTVGSKVIKGMRSKQVGILVNFTH